MSGFEIAMVQTEFTNKEISLNIKKMENLIYSCKLKYPNVQLILFPELCITGYFLDEELERVADSLLGGHFAIMSKIAYEQNIYLGYGYVQRGQNKELYNSFILISPSGECIGNYQKIHLTPIERKFFTPGSEIVVVPTELAKIGLMICWDLAFPEMARTLTLKGADIILAPSAWEEPYDDPYVLFGKARAIDNTIFLAICNHIGKSDDVEFFGESSIYSPDGNTLIKASSSEEIVVSTIDITYRKALQESFFTMLSERRPEIYEKEVVKGEI